MTENNKMPLTSMDVAAEKRQELKRLFPEVFSEDRVDFDTLRRVLGDFVEGGKERFGLNWPGKADCMNIIQAPSVATLKPYREKSVNFDETENLFIEGDNLEVLKLLQKSYFGKVKLIYIDPPYNTGNEFIYPDNFTENLSTYLAYSGQADEGGKRFSTNTQESGRYHSNWLNMIYTRLYLAKNLLSDDGAIFISIDDHEHPRLREVCDQIFGEENFQANICWQKRYTRSNNTVDFTTVVEHVVVYSKSDNFNVKLLPRTGEADARYTNPDNDPRGPWKGASFLNPASPQERPNLCYPLKNPNTGSVTYPSTNAWRRSQEAFEQLQNDNLLYWGPDGKQTIPSVKMFLSEARGLTPTNFWPHEYAGNTDDGTKDLEQLIKGKVFNNPKPVQLIKRAIEHVCEEDDIILDFFAGSGVTAQAVMELNKNDGGRRKFILVQLPEKTDDKSNAQKSGFDKISEITIKRIHQAINCLNKKPSDLLSALKQNDVDLGVKYFSLSTSNFSTWNGDPEAFDETGRQLELHIDHVDEAASAEDILYELLLKAGFELTTKIETVEFAGKEVFSIAEGALLICLEKEITTDLIDAMAEADPFQVICLDEAFHGNDQLKTNAVQTFAARAAAQESEIVFRTV